MAGAEARGFIRPEPDPEPVYGVPPKYTESQWLIFDIARQNGKSICEAFDIMEVYPYPAAQRV